jgi:hypothetical protein
MSRPSSGPKNKQNKSSACYLRHARFLHRLLFDHEDEGDLFLRNVGLFSTVYTTLYSRRYERELFDSERKTVSWILTKGGRKEGKKEGRNIRNEERKEEL